MLHRSKNSGVPVSLFFCINYGRSCVSKYDKCFRSQESLVYMTLSQIALATAMIFGLVALIILLYRILTHPMYMFGRTNESSFSTSSRALFSRASLSSMQRTIFWRLRDRPPGYANTTPDPEVPASNTNLSQPGEPPPLYDGTDIGQLSRDLPPAYAVAIISAPHLDQSSEVNHATVIPTQVASKDDDQM